MQQHKRCVERFLGSDPSLSGFLERIRGYSPVCQEHILVVNDSKYIAAIITCVEMPVLSGVEFYKKAVDLYPHINERIIFCTGNDNYIPFFRGKSVNYRIKPVPLNELRRAVVDILNRLAE